MIDEEVEIVLREIRERVISEQRAKELAMRPDIGRNPENDGAGDAAILDQNDQRTNGKALETIDSRLTITERAWDQLPPIVSNRKGGLARLELWVKRHAKTAARWFTWEQVNFNAAVHHALRDTLQMLAEHENALAAVRAQAQAESRARETEIEKRRAETEDLIGELRVESEARQRELRASRLESDKLRAELEAQRREVERHQSELEKRRVETDDLRSAARDESEALRIEIEKRRIEINNLRAQLRTPSQEQPKAEKLFAEPRTVRSLNECFFYHSMDIPSHGTIDGEWDLRGHESEYLGEVSFKDKRVLEIGPASGHLSFFMEREGAEVVSLEAADDYEWEFNWDIPDNESEELQTKLASHRQMMRRLKNSYWFAHRAFNSKARVHYGSAYALRHELGRFDISVIGSVLLHNKNPLKILENCARRTNDTMIVVEAFRETQLAQSPAEFLPKASESLWHIWWAFSPLYFVDILRSMGFPESRVTFHRQRWKGEPTDLFTVVACRGESSVIIRNEGPIDVEISSVVETLNVKAGALMRIPVGIINRGKLPVSSSTRPQVVLSYHWLSESGAPVEWDGLRTSFPRALYPGDSESLMLNVRAPAEPGSYFLDISLVKEHVKWYDEEIPGLPVRIKATVRV